MPLASIADFVGGLQNLPLLSPDQKGQLHGLQQQFPDIKSLGEELIRLGWLTSFQANRIANGRQRELTLGHYVVIDRLGEGGTGQVFKAWHSSYSRLVALKLLRPELVTDNETVSRFYREINVSGQLPAHPNLIAAFDSGQLDSTHFLAMEYVEGIDLERLVKQTGPLSIEQACEFMRQASQGLQHAHEHGLVHRDIKPSNLIVSGGPDLATSTVKLLDLGLARLHDDAHPRENTFMTSDGSMTLGTVDYQAPEQAIDFHRADIRADIYSLGCTFFYLLTGNPPFGTGSLAVKLMRHQESEPPSLKELRADVPDYLASLVARMLAKNPDDRYQTPGEVVEALAGPSPEPQRRSPSRLRGASPPEPKSRGYSRLFVGAVGGLALAAVLFYLLSPANPSAESAQADDKTPQLQGPVQKQKPPQPGSVEATVPEARDYQLVYDLNLSKLGKDIVYDEDRSAKITKPFDRIAYFMELRPNEGESQYLYVSMNAFTSDLKKIGVPTLASSASFQMNVANMSVFSNVAGIVTGTGIAGGNIEFWPNNYGPTNAMRVPNADNNKYDFGDQTTTPPDGHGCMQVHNHDAKQTLFAINKWKAASKAEIGIGNNPDPKGNIDWTFTETASQFRTKRLRVLVRGK